MESLSDKQVRMVACGAEHTSCTVVHGWVPDEEARACMACKKVFTTVKRRVSMVYTKMCSHTYRFDSHVIRISPIVGNQFTLYMMYFITRDPSATH